MSQHQKHRIHRRQLLKGLGYLAAASTLPATAWSQVSEFETDVLIIGVVSAFHLADLASDRGIAFDTVQVTQLAWRVYQDVAKKAAW